MREVFLVGAGSTAFGRSGRSGGELARDALLAALADADLAPHDLGAVAGDLGGAVAGQALVASLGPGAGDAAVLGEDGITTALRRGWQAVASGAHDVVACVATQGPVPTAPREWLLHTHARAAERYMRASGATPAHFAAVTAKNHSAGAQNPRAPLARAVDLAGVLAGEVLVWPLHELMVAPVTDGAAAVLLACRTVTRRAAPGAPRVRACVHVDGSGGEGAHARAALLAYDAAGIGPEDVDCAEVDDRTAAAELEAYEALQFVPEGQGPELVDSGFTALGGVLPVNPSGGRLSQGDAGDASGLAQVCELAWQLRNRAGGRQVPGARVGLALGGGARTGGPAWISLAILTAA